MRSVVFTLSSICLAAVAAFGCGGGVGIEGSSVGGACSVSDDCSAESRCLVNNDFPGGTCVVNCVTHEDCPEGSRCIEKEQGVCLLQCEIPGDCRGGYTCKGKKNKSTEGGESLICIKD